MTSDRCQRSLRGIAVGCYGISLWMREKPYQNHFDPILFAYAAFSHTCLAWIGAAVGLLYKMARGGVDWHHGGSSRRVGVYVSVMPST